MVRAIFFDFYSVWTPDWLQEYLNYAQPLGAQEHAALATMVEKYYHGEVNIDYLTDVFRNKLGRPDINKNSLIMKESDISPKVVNLMQSLHGHFLKLGILANLGITELALLQQFNTSNPLFEAILSPLSLEVKSPLLSQPVFSKALQTIGETSSSCLVVSGHEDYLKYASKSGMQIIKFTGFEQLIKSLGEILAKDIPSFVIPM